MIDPAYKEEIFIGSSTGKLRRRQSSNGRTGLGPLKQYGMAAAAMFSPLFQQATRLAPYGVPFTAATAPIGSLRLPNGQSPYFHGNFGPQLHLPVPPVTGPVGAYSPNDYAFWMAAQQQQTANFIAKKTVL